MNSICPLLLVVLFTVFAKESISQKRKDVDDCPLLPITTTMAMVGLERVPEVTLSSQVCKQLVEVANEEGYNMDPDSVDDQPVMDINVFNHGKILNAAVYAIIEPHLPTIKAVLDERFLGKPDVKNQLDWLFLRKYSAGNSRNGLLAHHDMNLHTMNIPLNEDYTGGGLYFIPPMSKLGKMVVSDMTAAKPMLQPGYVDDRCNTSDYFFPYMEVGVGTIYDKTVWHGVAEVREGTRYTLSLFYDEPQDVVDNEIRVDVTIHNHRRETPSDPVSLHWVSRPDAVNTQTSGGPLVLEDEDTVLLEGHWKSGSTRRESTSIGHIFCAMDRLGRVLKIWKVLHRNQKFGLNDEDSRFLFEDSRFKKEL